MLGTLTFAAITLGAVVFLLRFLVAIFGPDGKAPKTAYLTRITPEKDTPGGDSEVCEGGPRRSIVAHRGVAPIHAQRGERRSNNQRRAIATIGKKRVGLL